MQATTRTPFAAAARLGAALIFALSLSGCALFDGKDGEAEETAKAEPMPGEPRAPNWFERALGADERPNAGPCPLMGVLHDASRLVEFKQPEERYANVGFTAEMRGVRGLCRYAGADPIKLSMEVDMAFGRGPMAGDDEHTYRYWVAVTRTDLAPLAKEYFDVKVKFPKGVDRVSLSQQIEKVEIPRANETISGVNFEVLVGFELTPEQLAFNRAGKRFKVDAGSGG